MAYLVIVGLLLCSKLTAQHYSNTNQSADDGNLYIISNAHLDTQWSWTVETTINDFLPKTLDKNFALFEKYPNFNFNFEGAVRYMFIKEYYPEKYEILKDYIAQGRWVPAGGAIDANDVMVPSAESIIRNFLYGQHFFMQEFGVRGGRDIMLPDCFGFPHSLPTLGKHCGRDLFHTAKLAWGSSDYGKLQNYQRWRGVDGSEILGVFKPNPYDNHTGYLKDLSNDNDLIKEAADNKRKLGVPTVFRYIGPVGDQGGAVPDANGLWMETSLSGTGPLKVHLSSPTAFYESFTPEQISAFPVWDNELPMRTHGVGCYTSKSILKYWNRKNELLADATEKASYAAHWMGGLNYQSDLIRDSWIRILWHQFHDDLTGTSTPKAYSFTQNDHVIAQLNLSQTFTQAIGAISRNLDTRVEGIPLVVFNPLSIVREDIVEAKIQLTETVDAISVYNQFGTPVPTQIIDYQHGELTFIFLATVPSLGYELYDLRLGDDTSSKIATNLTVSTHSLENEEYLLTIDANGDVSSIIDKKQGDKELLESAINMQMIYNDPKSDHPSWEIAYAAVQVRPMEYVDEVISVSVEEAGPLRASIKIHRSRAGSEFVQYVQLSAFGSTDRIDFVNEVDWRTRNRLLKVEFPLTASNPLATFDTSIGTIQRPNATSDLYELNGHQWADITHQDNSYGISILNDCKYGWDKTKDNKLRLTLIHTPKATHVYPYQAIQDIGLNLFTYSFYRHLGRWNETTQWEAAKLNQPLLVYQTSTHDGEQGKSFSFVELNSEKVAVKALKKAEQSDEMIIRLYEITGENQEDVQISFAANILSAREVNGVEEELTSSTLDYTANKLSFSINKYQPKTFAIRLDTPTGSLQHPSSYPINLAYNIDVMSRNEKRHDGSFGKTNFAYPAELLNDEIVVDGIQFKIGSRDDGEKNALQCVGQQIELNKNDIGNKLYILAASQNKTGSKADFSIDGEIFPLHIEYFADFVGLFDSPFSEGGYKKENVAFVATHTHDVASKKDVAYSYLYMFKYLIPIADDAQTLTLPDNPDIMIFAITVSDNQNDDITPLSSVMSLPEHQALQPVEEVQSCGERLSPIAIKASGHMFADEAPKYAADDNPYTKWCDNSKTKWLEYDFGQDVEICQWDVTHAGIEHDDFITSDFSLQRYDAQSKQFIDVDVVKNNTISRTNRQVAPFITQKVRLSVTKAEQKANAAARIYSFYVYGRTEDFVGSHLTIDTSKIYLSNHPNPFDDFTIIQCNVPAEAHKIELEIYDYSGKLLDKSIYDAFGPTQEIRWKNKGFSSGLYFYTLYAKKGNTIISQYTGKMIIK